ncbi:MAG: hypothetical protein AB1589_43555, partial [Cyanobacteriota bacterium]
PLRYTDPSGHMWDMGDMTTGGDSIDDDDTSDSEEERRFISIPKPPVSTSTPTPPVLTPTSTPTPGPTSAATSTPTPSATASTTPTPADTPTPTLYLPNLLPTNALNTPGPDICTYISWNDCPGLTEDIVKFFSALPDSKPPNIPPNLSVPLPLQLEILLITVATSYDVITAISDYFGAFSITPVPTPWPTFSPTP